MSARKSVLVTGTQIMVALLGWIGLVVLVKFWGGYSPEALGTIGYALSFVGLFSIFADFGITQAHVKRISEGKDLGTCIGTFILVKTFLIILMVSVVLLYLHVFSVVGVDKTILYIFILYYILGYVVQIPTSTFQGKVEIAKRELTLITDNVVRVSLRIIIVLCGVVILGKTVVEPTITFPSFFSEVQTFISANALLCISLTYVIGAFSTVVVGMWLMRKYPISKPTRDMIKSYFKFAIPISLFSVSVLVTRSVDKVMIGYFWNTIEVGYYFTVQQISQVVVIISASIAVVLFPSLSLHNSKNNHKQIKDLVYHSTRYISMILLPIIVVNIVFAREIIVIMLDKAFLPGANSLIILSVFALVSGLTVPYTCLLTGMDKPRIIAKMGIIMCLSNVVLNLLIIPEQGIFSVFSIYGATGASLASVVSVVLGFVYVGYHSKVLISTKLLNSHTVLHILSGIVSGTVVYLIGMLFVPMHWYHLGALSLLCATIYICILIITKEFTRKDYDFFMDTLNVKQMIKYIKGELKDE